MRPARTPRRAALAAAGLAFFVLLAAAPPPARSEERPATPPAPGAPAGPKGLLDGRTFTGSLVAKGESRGDADTIVFRDGLLHSRACQALGFGDAPYHAGAVGEVIRFRADARSGKDGTMSWSGTVRQDVLEATVSLARPAQAPVLYSVKATRDKDGGTPGGR